MRVLSVVGARPQFVKLAPISHALKAAGDDHIVVHTGQHYDRDMSESFFLDLGIPTPEVSLEIGSDSHGRQTGRMLSAMDAVLEEHVPDWVLVYGDTNSTIAGALSAVKMHLPLAHLEAGLRSFNRRMPEEHNRVLTDHASDLCLAPSTTAMTRLTAEGLGERSVFVGDVMTDVLLKTAKSSPDGPSAIPTTIDTGRPFFLATIHRPDNTDNSDRLTQIIDQLAAAPHPVVLAVHPRLRAKAAEHGLKLDQGAITTVSPLSYPQLVRTVKAAKGVITDSGGLQKEAFLLQTPCFTVRTETEWVETVELGWNVLVPEPRELLPAIASLNPQPTPSAPYGDGHAAERVVSVLSERA